MLSNLVTILEFLLHLQTTGKSYSCLNIHRSMLSVTLDPINGRPIGQHPLVVRLMNGCYNLNPPTPRYSYTWDVGMVLNFMRRYKENGALPLVELSKKLATLLAIASLLRTAELASIGKDSIIFTSDGVQFTLLRPRKSQSSGPLRWISLTANADKGLPYGLSKKLYFSY